MNTFSEVISRMIYVFEHSDENTEYNRGYINGLKQALVAYGTLEKDFVINQIIQQLNLKK